MRRIYLSRWEKRVLRHLLFGGKGKPEGMDIIAYVAAVTDLDKKGLIKARLNYEEVLDTHITLRGRAYYMYNPLLLNPVNWAQVAAFAAIVAAGAGIAALFVSCLR